MHSNSFKDHSNTLGERAILSSTKGICSCVCYWFKAIPNKSHSRFIKFDIVEFYPSISENLLDKAIAYASSITSIPNRALAVIKNSRKSLLFDSSDTWVKKGPNSLFDVTMGCFDGAEVCELVGLYLLSKLSALVNKASIGLYRDDGLAVVSNISGPTLDRLRKRITALFKEENLSITIETNLFSTDFLDVTLDLQREKYYPYRKPNNKLSYINARSNHPPTIIKELPIMVNKRISDLSCDKDEFDKAKDVYELAFRENGHNATFKYEPAKQNSKRKRNRQRNILWFNPPYNLQVKTNIGKKFIYLIKKHFHKGHKLHKILNTNTIKLSYCCTTNMTGIIRQHNAKVLNATKTPNEARLCNCRNKQSCPLDGKCLSSSIVYRAEVTSDNNTKIYYGASEGEFKTRYNNHTKSFRHKKYCSETELSRHIWSLKDNNINYTLRWAIESFASPYKCGSKRCDLCLTEKLYIIKADTRHLLNKRNELISKCRHKNKYLLSNLK